MSEDSLLERVESLEQEAKELRQWVNRALGRTTAVPIHKVDEAGDGDSIVFERQTDLPVPGVVVLPDGPVLGDIGSDIPES